MCISLKEVTIGRNVESMGSNAFGSCPALTVINTLNPTPPTIDYSTFYYVDKTVCQLYVPYNCKKIYSEAAGWKEFINIQELITNASSVEITVADNRTQLRDGETVQLTACVLPEDTSDKTVVWTSANDSIATVNQDGLVTAHAKTGEVVITATCGEVSGSIEFFIAPTPVSSVEISTVDKTELNIGDTLQLSVVILPETATDKTVTWESSDTNVATVSDKGVVKAVGAGEAIIKVSCQGEYLNLILYDTCKITVDASTGISSTAESEGVKLYVSGNSLIVEGTEATVEVVALNGQQVYKGNDHKIQLTNGIYIVKTGKSVAKIII